MMVMSFLRNGVHQKFRTNHYHCFVHVLPEPRGVVVSICSRIAERLQDVVWLKQDVLRALDLGLSGDVGHCGNVPASFDQSSRRSWRITNLGSRHSSVDSSAPTRPGFESQAHHLRFLYSNFLLYLSLCWERDENKQKEARFGPFKKGIISLIWIIQACCQVVCFENKIFFSYPFKPVFQTVY